MEGRAHVMQSSITIEFPSAGLRVLVADHDSTSLNIVETMLQACKCQVVTASHPVEALDAVRTRKGGFDIILVELHMPANVGLGLLKIIRREFMLPIIMMSSDETQEAALMCLQNGASFYFTKPLSMTNLENLWQFVFLNKRARMEAQPSASTSVVDTGRSSSVNRGERDLLKFMKQRVGWTEERHLKFLQAIEIIGFQNAVPTKILKIMNEPGLSRTHVTSHLQKYRAYKRGQRKAMKVQRKCLVESMANLTFNSKKKHPSTQPSFGSKHKQGFSCDMEQQQPCLPTGVQQDLSLKSIPTSSQGTPNQSFLNQGNNLNYSACQMRSPVYSDEPIIKMIPINNPCYTKTPHGNNIDEEVQSMDGSEGSAVGDEFNKFGSNRTTATTSHGHSTEINYGYNSMGELERGKITHEEAPPFPPLEQELNGIGVAGDELVDLMGDVPMFVDTLFLQSFDEGTNF